MIVIKIHEKISFTIIFVLVFLGIALSHYDLVLFEGLYAREDGPLEWLSVLALLFGATICFMRAKALTPFRKPLFIICTLVLGSLFIFGAGEEISWGQRILGVKSPDFFMTHNSQMETNFHNLIIGGKKINKIIFGTLLGIIIGFYFLILPFLYRGVPKVKKIVDAMGVPLPKNFHIILYVLLAISAEFVAGGKKGEILEFGGCWIFVLMVLNPFNREIFSRVSHER